jgi:putative solute:sodium symporter small subunit
MENTNNDYHVSFFKPVTARARRNRNMVIKLVLVWAIAIFGFQIALKLLGKPTPEPALTEFNSVWENVKNENASEQELKVFTNSVLQCLGKIYIKPNMKAALANAFNYGLFQIAGDELDELCHNVDAFNELKSSTENIADPTYIQSRKKLEADVAGILELSDSDVKIIAVPFVINAEMKDEISAENKVLVEKAMKTYMTHNRSFLTDFNFLGFPFHYFYSAVFLLILFVGLCWIYCVETDKIEKQEPAA